MPLGGPSTAFPVASGQCAESAVSRPTPVARAEGQRNGKLFLSLRVRFLVALHVDDEFAWAGWHRTAISGAFWLAISTCMSPAGRAARPLYLVGARLLAAVRSVQRSGTPIGWRGLRAEFAARDMAPLRTADPPSPGRTCSALRRTPARRQLRRTAQAGCCGLYLDRMPALCTGRTWDSPTGSSSVPDRAALAR
jgi:hypothetical protein